MKLTVIRDLSWAIFAVVIGGCASAPTIDVRHDPVYRAEAHTAHIDVMATSESGIDHIDVVLYWGPLLACERDGLPSLFPCRGDTVEGQGFICEFATHALPPSSGTTGGAARIRSPLPKSAHCQVSHDFGTLSLLTYRASAVDGAGKSVSTNLITFSGGAVPADPIAMLGGPGGPLPPQPTGVVGGLDLVDVLEPPPKGPFAADVLRPMWLVSEGPPQVYPATSDISLNLRQHIDVGFLPDSDWGGDYRAFSDATGGITGSFLFVNAYGYNGRRYVEAYRSWRSLFSYWVGPAGASTPEHNCGTRFTGWADATRAVTDGQAVVHQTFFRDCGVLGHGGSATVSGTAGDADYIFVHESGHFLHCMGDEYPEDGIGHESCSDPPNTYPSKQQCEQIATQYGYPTAWCIPIGDSSAWWRISQDPGLYQDIMDGSRGFPTGYLSTDWYDTSRDVILKRMAACLQGACW